MQPDKTACIKSAWKGDHVTPVTWLILLLVLLVLGNYFGMFVVWGTVVAITFLWSKQSVAKKRTELLEKMLETHSSDKEISSEESHWMNSMLHKYWITCNRIIEKYSPYIAAELNQTEPSGLGTAKFRAQGFSLGSRPPTIESIETHSFLPDNECSLDVKFTFCPDRNFHLAVAPLPHMPVVPVRLSGLVMRGTARITISFDSVNPLLSDFSISLVNLPDLDCKITVLGQGDAMSLPGVYEWVHSAIENMLRPYTFPFKTKFQLQNHAALLPIIQKIHPDTALAPIVEIGVAQVGDILPDGWQLIHTTVSGMFSADLNRRTTSQELYLCYKRQTSADDKPPITGISVFFPNRGETVPAHFSQVLRTLSNQDANLNPKTSRPCYLSYSRLHTNPPITDLQIFNKTMEYKCPPQWTILEYSPTGHRANLNKSISEADELFIAYANGAKTPFGFALPSNPEQGLIRVTLVSAVNIKSLSDVGGMCDTYADMFISYAATGEKTTSKINRTNIAEKTSNPKWNQTSVFKASSADTLTILFYNITMTKDELLGVLKFPLDTLKLGCPITAWYEFQVAQQGHALVTIEALNFGLTESCQNGRPLHQIDLAKSGKRVRKFRIAERPLIQAASVKSSQIVTSLRGSGQRKISSDTQEENSSFTNEEQNSETDDRSVMGLSSDNISQYMERRGFLEKLSSSSYKKKSKRWVVLKDDSLAIYRTAKEKNSLENIPLKDLRVTQEDTHLILKNIKHKWELFANSITEAEDWAHAIRNNITVSQESQGSSERPGTRSDGIILQRNVPPSPDSEHRRTGSAPEVNVD